VIIAFMQGGKQVNKNNSSKQKETIKAEHKEQHFKVFKRCFKGSANVMFLTSRTRAHIINYLLYLIRCGIACVQTIDLVAVIVAFGHLLAWSTYS
jgi:hypothetical protein